MLLYAYLLVAAGLGLAALSLLRLLFSTAPLLWGNEGGQLSVARPTQGVVLGLGVAGVGFALLRLRLLQPKGKVSGLEKGRTGWALAAGVLLGVALAGGAAVVFGQSKGGEAGLSGDTARPASSWESAAAGGRLEAVGRRRSLDTASPSSGGAQRAGETEASSDSSEE